MSLLAVQVLVQALVLILVILLDTLPSLLFDFAQSTLYTVYMIGSIRGKLLDNDGNTILVETSAGIGYRIYVPSDTAASLFDKTNEQVFIYTYTVVREDTLDLYGFQTLDEKMFFERVINVSGVGPKSGLGIISIAPLDQLKSAIAQGDVSFLTKVSGIGKKSAQKIILELQDSLADELLTTGSASTSYHEDNEVLQALMGLGYSENQSRSVIKDLDPEIIGTEDRLRAALKLLS